MSWQEYLDLDSIKSIENERPLFDERKFYINIYFTAHIKLQNG